jgi:hypothetical protein
MYTENKSGSDITAKFVGTVEEVDAEVKVYFDNYHPAGYHTHITSEEIVDGIKTVYTSRWNNCD